MKLRTLINKYITYRKGLGEKFRTNEECLNAFCKMIGENKKIDQISQKDAL